MSHYSAAFVWGLLKVAPAQVDVSVVARSCASREGIRVHRIGAIDRGELRWHEGLWVSSPARAMLEIAATASGLELAGAVDEGLARRLSTRSVSDPETGQ